MPNIRTNDVVELSLVRSSLLSAPTHSRSHSKGSGPGADNFVSGDDTRQPAKRLVLQAVVADKETLSKQPQLQVSSLVFLEGVLGKRNAHLWTLTDLSGPNYRYLLRNSFSSRGFNQKGDFARGSKKGG